MSIDIRLPNITGQTESQRLSQVQSYIYQLAEQLNWALNTMSNASNDLVKDSVMQKISESSRMTLENAEKTFNSIKGLIMKSADIVQSYYDQMSIQLDGAYVAQSDFGTYAEQTQAVIEANTNSITQTFTKAEAIEADVDALQADFRNTQAWVKTGELDAANNIYGIEVGEHKEVGGVETYNKYARFTADGIYFYLPGSDSAIAWMTGNNLYIANARITESLNLGGFQLDLTNGITFKWVG